MTTLERDTSTIAPLDHATAMRLASTEYERVLALLRSFDADDWAKPTDCEGWDVRTLASHVVGMAESLQSLPGFIWFSSRVARRRGDFVDQMTRLQVEERRGCSGPELIARYERAISGALKTRSRTQLMRRMPVSFTTPAGEKLKWTLGFLFDTILTRDNWMHRVDLTRATGREMVCTPDHDGVFVADVVAEWARTHGRPFRLQLDGGAGGQFRNGDGGDDLTLDAVEFCRILSGRGQGSGLLTTEVPF